MEQKQVKEPSSTLIYVSNLPFTTTDEQFKDLFKGFGVKTAYVAKRKNGRSKGFGFANLEKESDQKAAIENINGKEMDSRKLIAKIAYNDERRNDNGELREEFKTQTPKATPSETVVHVSNLDWTVNDEELKKIFAEFNPKLATVATRRGGRSKGFGFVEFNNKEDQEKSLKLNGSTHSNRTITVQASTGYKNQGENNNSQNNSNRRPPRRNNNRNDNRGNNRGDNNRGDNRGDNRGSNRGNNRNDNNNGGKSFNVVRRNERRSENTLYISNLPFELDDNDLRQIFQEFHPTSAHIPSRNGGRSKGFGFIEFSNSRDQNEALKALDQSEVNGRVVTIKLSNPSNSNNNFNNRRNDNNNRRNDNNNRRNDNDNRRNDNNRNFNNNRRNDNDNRRNDNNNRGNNNNRTIRPKTPKENKEVSTNMVYVSNLPFDIEDKGLGEIFKGLKVSKAYVAKRMNGRSKGFGFVEFASTEDRQKAIENNGADVNGRPIVVQPAFKVEEKKN